MNQNPENQFKKFLIAIIVIVTVIIYFMVNPHIFQDLDTDDVMELSSDKPWKEELAAENDEIDDVDLKLSYGENEFKKGSFDNPFKENDEEKENEYFVSGSVFVNPMTDLNHKSKSEIYAERKLLVEETIFKNKSYKPSNDVFGQIEDNKPWLSIDALSCTGKGANANKGLSEESRYINNPTMLIGLDRISFDEKPKKMCSEVDYLMPSKINYQKDENEIKVVFNVSKYQGNLGRNFLLKGLNARDLGFQYGYANIVNNIVFLKKDSNLSNSVYRFKDFIHLGQACGVTGGCNNGSPNQPELQYTVMKYPASMRIKLWKKQPKSKDVKADINYLIILK